MKKKDTTFYLVLAGIVLLILWLLTRGSTASAMQAALAPTEGTVEIPAFNLPPNQTIVIPPMPGYPPITITNPPINIPGLPASNFVNYDMRSACACGGSTVPYYETLTAPPPPPPATSYSAPVMQPALGVFSGETITGPYASLGFGTVTPILGG